MGLNVGFMWGMILMICLVGCAGNPQHSVPVSPPKELKGGAWRGVHFLSPGKSGLPPLRRAIEESLAPMGVNVLILEVNYGYEYKSHPELRGQNALSKTDARELAALCRKHGIRLIPQFNCLGHQSWAKGTFPLLTKYPQFDETPRIPLDNPGIYCRSWCPLHPEVNKVVFALMDELIDAFQADAFHVGMDEVFLIADEQCPRCRGKNPAELFARAVNDYHAHLVKQKGLTMLMWGDRLLDARGMGYSEWDASRNGTAPAIDMIPKDIVMCDWHYGKRKEYPSIPYFQEKGFYVLPSGWNKQEASLALLQYARAHSSDKMLGHLCTTWYGATDVSLALTGEVDKSKVKPEVLNLVEAIRACMRELAQHRD